MNRKKFLTIGLLTTILSGVLLASIPFVSSLKPNAKADAALTRIDISDLQSGEAKLYDPSQPFEFSNGYTLKLYIYKSTDGKVIAWEVPTKGNTVGMPDLQWWLPFYPCENFGINIQTNLISCNDKNPPSEWWSKNWQWSLEGKNTADMVEDMYQAKGIVEGKHFVYGKQK